MNGIPGRRLQMSTIWWSRNHVGGHLRPRRVRMTKIIFKSCWPWKIRIGCCKEVCLMTTRLLETGPEGPQLGPPWVALSFAPGPHTLYYSDGVGVRRTFYTWISEHTKQFKPNFAILWYFSICFFAKYCIKCLQPCWVGMARHGTMGRQLKEKLISSNIRVHTL